MAKLSPQGKFRYGRDTGNGYEPEAGGKVYFYEAGTSTPKDTYTDSTEGTPNTNPVILDANGEASIWLASGAYKMAMKTSADVQLWEEDNVIGEGATGYLSSVTEKGASYSLESADKDGLLIATASLTFTLLAASTAGEGWSVTFKNNHTSAITIARAGSDTIDGATSYSLPADATVTVVCDGTNWRLVGEPITNKTNEWTATQNFNATDLSDGANISWDASANQVCEVTLAGNRTLDNPTNMVDGGTYILFVKQDATGSRTLSYGANYLWPSGAAPTLSTGANAVDILYFVSDGTNMYGTFIGNFS